MSGRLRAVAPSSTIEERYRAVTPTSAALMKQAAQCMPGGNTRTTSFHPPYPVVVERGQGPWLWDVDGRRYVDLFCNGLSLIHGNAHAPARQAIERTLLAGAAWSGASREQIAFAEYLCARIPAMESLRFTNSGSEAGMLAVKAARRFTGRRLIVKFVGAYHGSYPDLEAGLYGQGDLEGRACVVPFNDVGGLEDLMTRIGRDVAAIIIEPVLVTGRVVSPAPGFLSEVEALARRHGALTILDDCLMLRLAVGGSAEKFSLKPDIVVLGKFLGGGTPLGAFGASRELMRLFDPTHPGCVFHGGSFNGNPVGCAAGLVTLQDLTAERIAAMDAAAERLRAGLRGKAAEVGLEVVVSGMSSVAGISFLADPSRHEDDPSALGLSSLFHLAANTEGVLLGPGGVMAVSTAHDTEAIDFAIEALGVALARAAQWLSAQRTRGVAPLSTADVLDGYTTRGWSFLAGLQRRDGTEFVIGKAQGCHLWNLEGDRRVLDCGNSGGVHSLGHRNPELLATIRSALEHHDAGIWTMPTAEALRFQDALAAIAPIPHSRAVATLSSTDSLDLAVMFARRVTGRGKVAAYRHGYHGHGGFAALITGSDSEGVIDYYSLPRSMTGFFAEYDSIEAIAPLINEECAAVVLEPINFETFKPASVGFFEELAARCRRSGTLLIIDETRTGLSRSGQPFMTSRYAIEPDMLVLGKGLGGGLYPVSALLASEAVFQRCMNEGWGFMSSMAGSPIGLLVAGKVVEIIQRRELLDHVARLERLLEDGLRRVTERFAALYHPAWVLGGMATIGVRDERAARSIRAELFKRGVLCHSVSEIEPRVVKFLPCLTSDAEQVAELMNALEDFATDWLRS